MLTHSLATRVGLADVGNQLDAKFDSVDSIGFDDYADFLAGALFDRLADGSAGSVGREAALDGVDEVCWYVCGKTYCVGQKRLIKSVSPGRRVFMIFLVYCIVSLFYFMMCLS